MDISGLVAIDLLDGIVLVTGSSKLYLTKNYSNAIHRISRLGIRDPSGSKNNAERLGNSSMSTGTHTGIAWDMTSRKTTVRDSFLPMMSWNEWRVGHR